MYQPQYHNSSAGQAGQSYPSLPVPPSGYTSPDPYRASPIPMHTRSPYTSALSPPPRNGGYSPMSNSQSSSSSLSARAHPQYASRSGGARYPASPAYGHTSSAYPPLPVPPQQTPQQGKFKGTIAPGTLIKVGETQVRIERYLSEGGYAHVYLTTSDRPIYPPSSGGEGGASSRGRWGEKGYTQHCLKRIAFEDEKVWVDVRKEIEVMKALPPSPYLTQYLASAHSRLPSGGYEVFILMEFCSGGGIIDLLNKRLRDRLKEIEILNIFTDVCEAVAAMHFLKQPLLHRDLKIENVLSVPSGQPSTPQRPTPLTFKLCDFGSTTYPATHPPQNKIEAESLSMDLNKHTTLQYRSPEMVEPMLGWAVGLPSDVWALGVLLYKLCYYTTPFEEHGTLAIVNAKYSFPQYPVYSPKIQHLIASMLVDHPARRPTVFEILRVAHEMSGTRPLLDYPIPSQPFPTSQQPSKPKANSGNLLDFTSTSPVAPTPVMQPDLASSVQPQRRGRPTREPSQKAVPMPMGNPTTPQLPATPAEPKPPAPPTIQVTGEGGNRKEAADKQPSRDAFGVPTTAPSGGSLGSASNGFGDAFGAPRYSKGAEAISQRFGGGAPVKTWSASSGFSDSFASRSTQQGTAAPPAQQAHRQQRVASPEEMRRLPQPQQSIASSSNGDADISFETRFPSLDSLESGETGSTMPSRPDTSKSVSDLISPITSPAPLKQALHGKASMMGHLTGDTAQPHHTIATSLAGGPQPRSTQVTGTAFKGTAPPAVQAGNMAYLDKNGAGQTVPQAQAHVQPVDLMTGDAYSSMTGTSRQNSIQQQPVPVTITDRPTDPSATRTLPPLQTSQTARPKSRLGQSPEKAKSGGGESSDEDAGPESASRAAYLSSSPQRQGGMSASTSFSDRRAAFESSASAPSAIRDRSPTKLTSGTAPKPQFGNMRHVSSERIRPQSMFIPSSASATPLISPVADSDSTAGPARPSHGRKGSIGDMVSKYQSLQVPSIEIDRQEPEIARSPVDSTPKPSNGLGRKPSVATKPQGLRRQTIETKPTVLPSSEKANQSSPPSAVADRVEPAPVKTKPVLAPKPSRHGDMPTIAGYSKSSSGRSFPISKPAISSIPSAAAAEISRLERQADAVEPKTGSRQGSPDKQQSVGSLIARWNQTK